MRQAIDLSGKKFGCLTVLKRFGTDNHGHAIWFCICKCGKSTTVSGDHLKSRHTQSCGCFRRKRLVESQLKHGHACRGKKSDEYIVWRSMIARCYDPNHIGFVRYGGRGIKICNRWRGVDGFKNFYSDIGKRPTSKHSLDRKNNNEGYNKKNCRWATNTVQSLNRRMGSNNKSGIIGVYYDKKNKKFRSYISINGRQTYLGFFEKFDDAVSTRKIAEEKYYKSILEQAK